MTTIQKVKLPPRPEGFPMHEYRTLVVAAILKGLGPSRIDAISHAYRTLEVEADSNPCQETLKRTVLRMEKRGLVERWGDPNDGRAVLWTLV